MQDVMRDLQILLEQSKLWKGELARHPIFPFRKKWKDPSPRDAGLWMPIRNDSIKAGGHVLGEFYG